MNMPFSTRCSLVLLLALALTLPLAGPALGADQKMLAAVEAFLYEQIRQPGDEVAISLQPSTAVFPTCENPRPFLPQTTRPKWGRITVGVRCGTIGSARYLQAEVSVTGDYLTVAAQIPAGTAITAGLLEIVRGDKSQLPPNAIFNPEDAIGLLARHTLAPGTVVQSQQLYRLPLVEFSQKVVIETQGAGFSISSAGEALESGALGDTVRVRINRQQTLSAVVTGAGRVSVGL